MKHFLNGVRDDAEIKKVVLKNKPSVRSALINSVSPLALLAASTTLFLDNHNLKSDIALLLEAVEQFENDTASVEHDVMSASHQPLNSLSGAIALPNNPATPILDLIGQAEGTDRGDGYNETLAYGRLTGGDVVLVDMTLAEIDELQTAMLNHPENRWNSSAVGRYQIVRTTLRALKKKLGLADTVKFTPELQDRLAIELLNGRGFEAWKAGRIADSEFALELSKEWASLPNPQTGKGNYPGQRAAVDFATVEGVLDQIRPEQTTEKAAVAVPNSTVTLSAAKPINTPVTVAGDLNITSAHDWEIAANAEYERETDTYKVGGSASYENDDLSISLSGTHNSDDNTEFKAEVKYRF